MAIFPFKSKGKKAEGKEEGEKKEEVVGSVESKPAQFRKYTLRHAAADASGHGSNAERSHDFEDMSQMRKQMFNPRADASYASSINSRRREAFTTHANDYYSPGAMRKLQANDPSLGYTKVALARQDQGLGQCSSDSGYESAGPSRVPSEYNSDETSRPYLPRPNSGLLPELRLGDDSLSDRSSKSATKKTRFQVATEPVSMVEQPPIRTIDFATPVTVIEQAEQPAPRNVDFTTPVLVPERAEQPSSRKLNLAALEGLKVNKKGRVLDEEGDIIAELVIGDLLDCIRQKVNAKGEVLDDIGKVVGIVKLAVTSLPELTVRPPTGSQIDPSMNGESGLIVVPQSPIMEAAGGGLSPQDSAWRSARSASERSLSELSKPYARPPMSSVPENNVAVEEGVQASPELFSYKGEIPVATPQHIRRRSASPPSISAHMSPRKTTPRRTSTSGIQPKVFGKQPINYTSRRPLSSYDNSPNGSDDGTEISTSDDGKLPPMMYKRPASVRSAMTVKSKPKTYFTHGGRITVDPATLPLPTHEDKTKPVTQSKTAPADAPAKQEKKKGILGMRFGKK